MERKLRDGEIVTQGCERQVIFFVNPDKINTTGDTKIFDSCSCDGTGKERATAHVFRKGQYVGTNGCLGCINHTLGTEPPRSLGEKIVHTLKSLISE